MISWAMEGIHSWAMEGWGHGGIVQQNGTTRECFCPDQPERDRAFRVVKQGQAASGHNGVDHEMQFIYQAEV